MTESQIKKLIRDGLSLKTLKEVNARIDEIYLHNDCNDCRYSRIIDGRMMDKLIMLQIDLETGWTPEAAL